MLIAEEDGGVYSCDHFVDAEHRIGSLQKDRLGILVDSPFQQSFGQQKRDALTDQCRRCPWLACCNGGCPKDRFALSRDGEEGQYYLCPGLEAFFAHAHGPLHRVMELSRGGKKPEEIMRILNETGI